MRVVTPNRVDSLRNKRRGMRALLIGLILLLLFLIFLCIWMLRFRTPTLAPDYAPPKEDSNAVEIEGDNGEKLDKPEGGGAIGMTYRRTATVDLSEKEVDIMYQNPNRSNSDVMVQIVIRDVVIAQSGRVPPGKQIHVIDLLPGVASMLEEGGYDAEMAVFFYDPVTAERSLLQARGEISLTVVK
ncbi:MAG: hypothetical protein IJF15_05180 [Oscillospiraceae bacterium]|nr:hypothetical protein [Oscillospiraceae bacterium]